MSTPAPDTTHPLVSVITPLYNGAATILETLESISLQTYTNIEMIVVNDGSTDGSPDLVAREFPQARLIHKANGGQPTARNAGLREAKGELISFLDADDLWAPDKVEKQIELFQKNSALQWAYTDSYFFRGTKDDLLYKASDRHPLLEGDVLEQLLVHNFIPSPTLMFRRQLFDRVGLWDETVQTAEDWHMWLRIALEYPIGLVDEPLAYYRRHDDSKIAKTDLDKYLANMFYIIDKYIDLAPERLAPLRERSKAKQESKIALSFLRRGGRSRARQLLWRAFKRSPERWYNLVLLPGCFLPYRVIVAVNALFHWFVSTSGKRRKARAGLSDDLGGRVQS